MSSTPTPIACPGCGARLPDVDGPTHRYMESSPACWAVYGQVLAREYGDPAYMAVHRLTVDSYAVQHPGRPSSQAVQSVAGHLIALHATLEQGWPAERVRALIARVVETGGFHWLTRPDDLGAVTVADVVAARSAEEHAALVRRWAESAWAAWACHHDQVAAWIDERMAS